MKLATAGRKALPRRWFGASRARKVHGADTAPNSRSGDGLEWGGWLLILVITAVLLRLLIRDLSKEVRHDRCDDLYHETCSC